MDPQTVFCPNRECPARGQVGEGKIGIHSRKEQRYRCRVCGQTFAARKGTAFYRLRTAEATVTLVVTLLAHGCPLQAIVVAFGLDERTVQAWQARAGTQCQQVQAHLVERPRDLGQVQADELWVKLQGVRAWMAMALQVSTRLWLGGVVSAQRDRGLIDALVQKIRACASRRPLLVCVDGLATYVNAVRRVFRDPQPRNGQTGRRRLKSWRGLYLAQVVKQYAKRRVVAVVQRIVQGKRAAIQRLIDRTQGGGGINTAYIERLNATFRARLHRLVRRGRGLGRQIPTLQHGMYLIGAVYNFCTFHDSLRIRRRGRPDQVGHRWHFRTPAMAAGLSEHRWSVHELLMYQVPPPRWTPPKRRGRVSKATQALVARWCA
ncbi:MAG: IS1/IS6 family transposase [Anaerolineales bacterium]|nr:IS1/IS6 family transposase [Anaerolineales bacterium]